MDINKLNAHYDLKAKKPSPIHLIIILHVLFFFSMNLLFAFVCIIMFLLDEIKMLKCETCFVESLITN